MKSSLPPRTPITSGFFKQAAKIQDAARIAETVCDELKLSSALVWLESIGVDQAHGQLASSDRIRDLEAELGQWFMGLAGEYTAPDELKKTFKANQVYVSPISSPSRQLGVIAVASSVDREVLRGLSARVALELEAEDRERLVEYWKLNAPAPQVQEDDHVVSSAPGPRPSTNDNGAVVHLRSA